jgi:hypothetical protein
MILGGLLISSSIIMFPFVLVLFLAIEYFLGIVTKQRLRELLVPLTMLYRDKVKILTSMDIEENGV